MSALFFGYGSLVNAATHDYTRNLPAVAHGWRRAWRGTAGREAAFLTVIEDPASRIEGVVAEVPGGDWAALDEREASYDRLDARHCVRHGAGAARELAIYAIPPRSFAPPSAQNPILLSYLDVVLQGYLRVFGARGARGFVESTTGWEAPVLDDRAAPRYPRHQRLEPAEREFVDSVLRDLGSLRLDPVRGA